MGLGKTFVGSEKLKELNNKVNLLVCQKSKIDDWIEHFKTYYPKYKVFNLRNKKELSKFLITNNSVGIINYDLVWRRPTLLKLSNFTLVLDESSYVKNEKSKRTKFVLKLKPSNVILLSGTPTGGKYEELWSQCQLLGWDIKKKLFYDQYIITQTIEQGGNYFDIVVGYKNVDRLKAKLREYGAVFMKTNEVYSLPEQRENIINVPTTKEYQHFRKHRIIDIGDETLVGDTTLTNMLYQRMLAGLYNPHKWERLEDLLNSTRDRLIIFYNFKAEFEKLKSICEKLKKPISYINGNGIDLDNYKNQSDSVTLAQYQSGAMGHNLQKSFNIIYFSLPLSSELFEQSKKRIHRIGQKNKCNYYYLLTIGSVEYHIWETLKKRRDFTNKLFEEVMN